MTKKQKELAFQLRVLHAKNQLEYMRKLLSGESLCDAYTMGYTDCLNFLLSDWPNEEEKLDRILSED